ncbi:hypothetical protein PLICRDRAFT_179730 [Plicaturopsis crispa FD-325 SS-3]|uniref:SMP domain-containing protein n=1 Tax=Plicaturopsis crispa FD-325 SS-3 TaxID=944288 RepID=A0A0C9SKN5_PLICR|nr:hypothetical protein PLICRDRAFT_179730 [Plicaturopsis crispa FD-325 SS-3]
MSTTTLIDTRTEASPELAPAAEAPQKPDVEESASTLNREAAVEDASAAQKDAEKISSAKPKTIDLSTVNAAAARTLMSVEHKALNYRPPPGSLAANAQAAAAQHPDGAEGAPPPPTPGTLKTAALLDAERIEAARRALSNANGELGVDISGVGEAEARKLMSAAHKTLGFRPPPGSLAAEAQRVAAKQPGGGKVKPDVQVLTEAAKRDAVKIASERNGNGGSPVAGERNSKSPVGSERKAGSPVAA